VLPSVVNVRVTEVTPGLFGPQTGRGEGSGVVISRNGIILTNNHVVQNATTVTVVFNNGKRMRGHVLGTDPQRDLAVIKVNATNLKPIQIGHSSQPYLRLGDSVIAIGFPLGLGGPTVTKGIVSAEGRTINVANPGVPGGREHLENIIQTDAAINPGNSGGALVNMNGQLVGINSAAASAASAENIGFAISIDSALPVIKEILTKPLAKRAWLGVYMQNPDPVVATQLGLNGNVRGAFVIQVIPGSPAQRAGLKQGDVIVSVDGRPVTSADDLTSTMTRYNPGETVTLGIESADGRRTVRVTLVQRPPQFAHPK
jgi:S1-C subfamily serine protease